MPAADILSNQLVLMMIFWWGPGMVVLFGLYLLLKKFIPGITRSYIDRIDEQTKVLRELQHIMAEKAQTTACEHREMLILLKTLTQKGEQKLNGQAGDSQSS